MIPEELKQRLRARIAASISPREAAVDVMKELQGERGWLTDEAVVVAAELLGLSTLQVEELATFYEMIYRRPVGRRVLHVCDSISCWAVGCETLMAHLRQQLGVEQGETTADGMFTLLPCACLGNCGDGPAMMVGTSVYDRVTPAEADGIIAREREAARGET
jgi:NADH-quinone oxidoreductase subunit E